MRAGAVAGAGRRLDDMQGRGIHTLVGEVGKVGKSPWRSNEKAPGP